ncbi:MAG: TolC family protein [Terriglobia bacterium]
MRRRKRIKLIWEILLDLAVLVLWVTAAKAQTGPAGGPQASNSSSGPPPAAVINIQGSSQNPFLGSVPSGRPTSTVLALSLKDALERGLKTNLGILLDAENTNAERGQRWQSLSRVLPRLTTSSFVERQQINLAAFGFPGIPGIPTIVGPFSIFDARAYLTAPVLDLEAIRNLKAAASNVRAAEYSYHEARDLVVLAVGNAYLEVNAEAAQVAATQAQVNTAEALYHQAADQLNAGVSPKIDVLRAQVELQSRRQQLLAAKNQLETGKLQLARVIGLPSGQAFEVTDKTPFAPLEGIAVPDALVRAYANRPDYKSAEASVQATELARRAVMAERYPSVSFGANFGDIGLTLPTSHETFAIQGTLNIPVFQGGKIHGELLQADAALRQKKDQLADLKAQIDYQVRTALLNLKTAEDQVQVAKSNEDLAHQTLEQAQDRFKAGVADNIEVVEAQESVANADQSYISSLYAHNLAKVSLAQAMGIAEQAAMQYLEGSK